MPVESTFALVKPDAHARAGEILLSAKRAGFEIAHMSTVTMTESKAKEFYAEHADRPFFPALVEFMTSGPATALILRREGAVVGWRELLGPTSPARAREEAPDSLRARFGTDDTRNGTHGSDSAESAAREIAFFFPEFDPPKAHTGTGAKEYLNRTVCPLLTRALTDMCRLAPERPVEWLGHYLLGVSGKEGSTGPESASDAASEATPKQRIFFVLGGPGSGKGTQCSNIVEQFGFAHFSAGDLLRAEVKSGSERGVMIGDMIKDGKIVPGEITIELLKNAIAGTDKPGVLIDGFPRKLAQAGAFEKEVSDFEFVLFLDCPENVMEERLLERGQTSGRSDDNAESIRKRFMTFVVTSMPVIEYYEAKGKVHRIDATKSRAEVFDIIKALF